MGTGLDRLPKDNAARQRRCNWGSGHIMAIKIGWWTDDSLAGTSGDDWIEGLSGEDTIEGLEGDDSLYGSSGEDSILGGDGDDTLDGGSQDDVLSGGTGEDTLDGDSGDDLLSGGADADYLTGDSGDDSLFGGTGDDTLRGGTDSDLVDGGAGDDLIIEGGYEGGNDTIVFGADSGHDTVRGFSPTDDYVHIGDASLDDVILTPTSNPKIWVMTLDGVPDASLTLDFTYYWDSGVTVEELIPQVINNNDYTLPDDPFPDPICLTMGAMVDTTAGPKPVEALRPGDQLLTYDAGPRPLVGVLRHRVPAAQLAKNPALRPVEIAAGAFGGGLPRRDMLVSMQHWFPGLGRTPRRKGRGADTRPSHRRGHGPGPTGRGADGLGGLLPPADGQPPVDPRRRGLDRDGLYRAGGAERRPGAQAHGADGPRAEDAGAGAQAVAAQAPEELHRPQAGRRRPAEASAPRHVA